jgi:hypothetical protein
MRSVGAVVERVGTSAAVDWESPAGPVDERVQPGLDAPVFLFTGPGEAHWIGQRCDVLGTLCEDPKCKLVRLACGCRAQVPLGSLQPA